MLSEIAPPRRTTASDVTPAASPERPAPAGPAAISLAGIAKTYPRRGDGAPVAALREVDLDVRPGRIFGIIGPSGAGKSTLIRLVNGLERASEGTIRLFGKDVTGLDERAWRDERRGIGMIFQHFNLLSSRTAAENVALPLEIQGARPADIAARVEHLLALVGLSDKRDRYPAELSGGQKQRVGIARALASEPRILLCDEATSALDPETTRAILALLRRINREIGVTVLLITHEIPVIKEICDDVAVIADGRIVERGAVFDVFTAPRHPVTQRFVEGVTRVDPPPALAEALRARPEGARREVLRVSFHGDDAASTLIASLSAAFDGDVTVPAARVDAIGGRPFGSLIATVPVARTLRPPVEVLLAGTGARIESLGFVASDAHTLPETRP